MFKDFLYALTNSIGQYYRYVDQEVKALSDYKPVKNTPDGWMEKSIRWTRDKSTHGIFRNFTTPLKYVTDSARIIRDRLYRFGTEDVIKLVIHKLDKSFGGGWVHKKFYEGELDLTTAKDTDDFITCNIAEDGIMKLYEAGKNNEYEIPLDNAESVLMDGVQLSQQASYVITNGALPNDLGGASLDMQLLNIDGVSEIGATTQARIKGSNSASALWNTNNWCLETGAAPTQVTVDWDFFMTPSLDGNASPINPTRLIFQFNILTASNVMNVIELQTFFGDPLLIYSRKHFQGSATFTVPANAKCVTYMSANQNRDFTFWTYENGGSFNIKYSYLHRKTMVQALPPMILGQRLIDNVFGQGYTFQSSYLSNEWRGLFVTSGDGLRGISGSVIKTSLMEFFDSYNVPCNLSMNLKDKIISFERKSNSYQQQTVYDFGEVSQLSLDQDKEWKFNIVEIGYTDTDTEDVNGKLDFNVTQTWEAPTVKKSPKKLSIVSNYRAGCFEIELLRINLAGKTTTDSKSDNVTFFLHVSPVRNFDPVDGLPITPSGYYKLYRKNYTDITGFPYPASLFNVELRPRKCIEYHGDYLRSIFYWQEQNYLEFRTSEKNADISTNDNGTVLEEKSSVYIGGLAAPLFIPMTATFESPVVDSIAYIMQESSNKQFKALYDGIEILGFCKDVSLQPADEAVQKTILTISPQTDILKFISDGR